MITVAVEGDTDVPFVRALCKESGFDVRAPVVAGGKDALARYLPSFAAAGRGSPHLVVRDLDQDAACAGLWIVEHAPTSVGAFFAVRLAVRAIESWFLADRVHAAKSLSVHLDRIPLAPDDEVDPKRTIVSLARGSSKPAIREALVPSPGMSRKAGRGYEAWLLGAAQRWSVRRAAARSPSLARAQIRLQDLGRQWSQHLQEPTE